MRVVENSVVHLAILALTRPWSLNKPAELGRCFKYLQKHSINELKPNSTKTMDCLFDVTSNCRTYKDSDEGDLSLTKMNTF